MVTLATFKVGADRDPGVVGTKREHAHREELTSPGFEVFIQNHLFALDRGERIDDWRREVVALCRHTSTDGVVEPLTSSLKVPPSALSHWYRNIGLFNAILDLFVEFVLEGLEGRELLGEELVLGPQVREDLFAVAVHQPVVGVDPFVAMADDAVGTLGNSGRRGHHPILPVIEACSVGELVLYP